MTGLVFTAVVNVGTYLSLNANIPSYELHEMSNIDKFHVISLVSEI